MLSEQDDLAWISKLELSSDDREEVLSAIEDDAAVETPAASRDDHWGADTRFQVSAHTLTAASLSLQCWQRESCSWSDRSRPGSRLLTTVTTSRNGTP